jgi:NAD(P)-dependent dehydrogenase (short-subunit alcohol dehydrogenase family)
MTDARRYVRPINAGANLKPRDSWPRFNGRGPGHGSGWRAVEGGRGFGTDPRPSLTDRAVVLVGVEHGLGAALFAVLHAQGARLLALDRTFSADQRKAAEIACDPTRLVLRYTDLGDPASLPTPAELAAFLGAGPADGASAADDAGPADGGSAGSGPGAGREAVLLHTTATAAVPIDGQDIDAIGVAVQVNLVAPICLTNLFLSAAPADQRRVRLVYVASGTAHRAGPGWAAYQAAEAAIETFMRSAQRSAGPRCTVDIVHSAAFVDGTPRPRPYRRATGDPDRRANPDVKGDPDALANPDTVAARIINRLFAAG